MMNPPAKHPLHRFPNMSYEEARRHPEVIRWASEHGLLVAANRIIFHPLGLALTREEGTTRMWVTPTADAEGWLYDGDDDDIRKADEAFRDLVGDQAYSVLMAAAAGLRRRLELERGGESPR